jgi:nucleosome binding factor SPN SPT16 subunit
MLVRNFQYLIKSADRNGVIDIDDVVAVKFLDECDTVIEAVLSKSFKKQDILQYLKHTYIVYMDKYGNGHSRIIY